MQSPKKAGRTRPPSSAQPADRCRRDFIVELAQHEGTVQATIKPMAGPPGDLAGIELGDRVLDLISDLLVELVREEQGAEPTAAQGGESLGPTDEAVPSVRAAGRET